jgi:hypothetical protein
MTRSPFAHLLRARARAALTAVSLVLLIATCALWARSLYVRDILRYALPGESAQVQLRYNTQSMRGRILLGRYSGYNPGDSKASDYAPGFDLTSKPPPSESMLVSQWSPFGRQRLGFGHFQWDAMMSSGNVTSRYRATVLTLPHWALAVLFAAAPAIWSIRQLRQRARRAKNRCPACGYDIRATPAADGPLLSRCPECGEGNAAQILAA